MIRRTRPLALVLALALLLAGCGSKTSELETGGINAVDLLNQLMSKTTRIVGGVTGVKAAEAALPELEQVNEDFDQLIDEAEKLSPGARGELAEEAARFMPGLKDNARRMNTMKGVDEILGPVMNEMVGKLAQLQ